MNIEITQLEDNLAKLPFQIREQELKVIEARKKVEEAKLEYDVAFGMTLTASSAPNATEKKQWAVQGSRQQAMDLITAKYEYEKESAGLNYLTNRFIGLRKISSIEERLMSVNITGN